MTTEAGFEALVEGLPPELQGICRALRAAIARLHPGFVERVWLKQRIASFGVGPRKMSEHYAYIAPQAKHVNLGLYHGADAFDPAGLLEGTGKQLRHVKLRSLAGAEAEPLKRILAAAVAERKSACA